MDWENSSIQMRLGRRPEPPWHDNVDLSPELVYRYQLTARTLDEVLKADLKVLKGMRQVSCAELAKGVCLFTKKKIFDFELQPVMINDQLNQLVVDLELDGHSSQPSLSELNTDSSTDDEETQLLNGNLSMIHEENAPIPSPLER